RIIASKSIANGDTGVASHSRSTWRPASVIEYTVRRRFPTDSRLAAPPPLARAQPHGGQPLDLAVDRAFGPRPHVAEVADSLSGQLIGGPRTHGQLGQDGEAGRGQPAGPGGAP